MSEILISTEKFWTPPINFQHSPLPPKISQPLPKNFTPFRKISTPKKICVTLQKLFWKFLNHSPLSKIYQPPLKVSQPPPPPPWKYLNPTWENLNRCRKKLNLLKYVSRYHPLIRFSFFVPLRFSKKITNLGGGGGFQHVTPLKISQPPSPPPLKISQPLPKKCHPAKIC